MNPQSVSASEVTARFYVANDAPAMTSSYPELAGTLLAKYPELKRHRCDSGQPSSFPDEMKHTEVAHVIEHLAVEILALLLQTRRGIGGKTGWQKEGSDREFLIKVWAPADNVTIEQALFRASREISTIIKAGIYH